MINSMMWGISLIILGLLLIIKTIFGITIPVVRVAIGALFMYAGITLITGIGSYSSKQTRYIMFKQETVRIHQPYRSYNVLFGNGVIDLSIVPIKKYTQVDINVLFGLCVVKLSAQTPTKIHAESFLGGLQLPDESVLNWGKKRYIFTGNGSHPLLEVNAKAVFGNLVMELV